MKKIFLTYLNDHFLYKKSYYPWNKYMETRKIKNIYKIKNINREFIYYFMSYLYNILYNIL